MQATVNSMEHQQGLGAYQTHQQFGQKAREQRLITLYAPVVKRVIRHLQPQADAVMSSEDMEQIGLMALLDVIRRYPDEDDDTIGRLITPRIRGAVLDELRRMDWRSRRNRQRSHELRDTERVLRRQLGRSPTERELAQHLDISMADVQQRRLDEQAANLDSVETLSEEGEQFFGLSFQCQAHERAALKSAMNRALSQLNERERLVLSFYYEHEMNLKEIALVFDLTEARVSQIHKGLLKKLNTLLGDWRDAA